MLYAKINGLDYPLAAGFSVEEQIGNKTSSSICVAAGNRPAPVAGDLIELLDSVTESCVFWGVCSIVKSSAMEFAPARRVFELTCANANALLSRRLVNVALQNKTVTQIVTALFDAYIAPEGITPGTLSTFDAVVEIYTASDLNLQKALDELAELVGAGWTVTADRRFIFARKEDFPRLGTALTENMLPVFGVGAAQKDSDMRTVQIIKGATEKTDLQLESHVYNGLADSFTLSFPVSAKPVVRINGVTLAPACVGVNGPSSGNAACVFLFSFQSAVICYNPSNTTRVLQKNDVVEFEYVGFFPIRVETSNYTRINAVRAATGTSGIIENVTVSHALGGYADAQGLAAALLDDFGRPRSELSFSFDSRAIAAVGFSAEDFALFTVLDIRLESRGLRGEYIITERRLEPLADANGVRFRVGVKCVDRSILKGYGSVLFTLRHELSRLRVRADEKVLSNISSPEALCAGELMAVYSPFLFYPTDAGSFEPCDLCAAVYPS